MKKCFRSLYVIFMGMGLIVACDGNHPVAPPQPPAAWNQKKLPIVRTNVSTTPAFYQFDGGIGNAPQRPFDPGYSPKSRNSKRRKLTLESAGSLIYTDGPNGRKNEKYVLLGKEKTSGEWNFMRGSVDVGDSYVQGAVKELNQETAGVYEVTEAVLLSESFDVFYHRGFKNYACTFFVKLDYVSAKTLVQESRGHPDPHFREMTDYAWILLDDLRTALTGNQPNFTARTISGKSRIFNFYLYSFRILQHANKKDILGHLY